MNFKFMPACVASLAVLVLSPTVSAQNPNSGYFYNLNQTSPATPTWLMDDLIIKTPDTAAPFAAQLSFQINTASPTFGLQLAGSLFNQQFLSLSPSSSSSGEWRWSVQHSYTPGSAPYTPTLQERSVMSVNSGGTLTIFDPVGVAPGPPAGYGPSIYQPLVTLSPSGLILRTITNEYGSYQTQIEINPTAGITLGSYRNITMNGGNITGAGFITASGLTTSGISGTTLAASTRLIIGSSVGGTGNYSGAVGNTVTINGSSSFAAGSNLTTTGSSTFVVGDNNTAASAYSAVFGRYALAPAGQSSTTWVATDDLFVIGNGIAGQASNALTIKKNGATALGKGLTTSTEAQTVVGSYNDTNPDATTTPPTDRTAGVFIVGAGQAGAPKNAMRITADGRILIQPSGDIDMGAFTAGEKP
jgi:hypothetical protein